jgi:hypothetical protein
MLTAQETDQLVRDMQREFPALSVDQRRHRASREYVVVVRDPANGNEVRVTSLKGDWRRKVAAMVPITRPRRQRPIDERRLAGAQPASARLRAGALHRRPSRSG